MPSLDIAPHPEGCTGPGTMPAQGVTSASGAMPTDVTFSSSGDWGSSSSAFAISHGSRRRLSPAPGPDRRFAGMRLSRSPHGSGLAIGPRNLPSSSSRLRRGYDKAPRGAIPVVVEEAFATRFDLAVIGVAAGDLPARGVRDERPTLLQAGQHAGDALAAPQAAVVGLDEVFFAYPLGRGLQDRDATLIGELAYPGLVGVGALFEDGRLDARDADDIMEEVHQVLGPLQALEIAVQHDAIPAGVDELDSLAQDCRQSLHGMTLLR